MQTPTNPETLSLRDAARLVALAKGSLDDLDTAAELLNAAYPDGWPRTIHVLYDRAWGEAIYAACVAPAA